MRSVCGVGEAGGATRVGTVTLGCAEHDGVDSVAGRGDASPKPEKRQNRQDDDDCADDIDDAVHEMSFRVVDAPEAHTMNAMRRFSL